MLIFSLYDTVIERRAGYEKDGRAVYAERFYVGYRWHDKTGIAPLFPFGWGLSYTTFERGEPASQRRGEDFVVTVPVTNTGKRAGADVVRVYASWPESAIEHPPRSLVGFEKVFLQPGETKQVEISLPPGAFEYWDAFTHSFKKELSQCRLTVE